MRLIALLPAMALFFKPPVLMKYEGGSRYHSRLILTLYQDSTFTYSAWYHSGQKKISVFKGIWRSAPSKLTLDSKKKNAAFRNESFILKGDTLKLYSREDSIKNYSFYKEYFTLIRKP